MYRHTENHVIERKDTLNINDGFLYYFVVSFLKRADTIQISKQEKQPRISTISDAFPKNDNRST